MTDEGCPDERDGSPAGLNLPTTGESSSDFVVDLLNDEVPAPGAPVSIFMGSSTFGVLA